MVAYIHKEFIETLDKIEWFNEMTREKALEKAHSIKTHIGYPEQLLDNSKIAEVYEDVSHNEYKKNSLIYK
jgi:predicted metalloendopeptidase